MKKILVIVGTRPEAIKLIPVYKELRKVKNWQTFLISTGQHREMLRSIFDFFEVRPDVDLKIMTKNQSLGGLTALLMHECTNVLLKISPQLIIVQGDTTTAMVAALAAYYLKIPIAHIEAGLRSYDIQAPFPEEVNRRVISLTSDFHFAPTKMAANVLKREKLPGKIFTVGNTVIDSLLLAKRKNRKKEKYFVKHYEGLFNNAEQMVLITGHRRESFGEGFKNICLAIRSLAILYPNTSFIYPVHLNPNVRGTVFKILDDVSNVYLIDPIPYDHMVFLMTKCKMILTDSGGIQEEAPSLGKPVIIMRNKTERPEGVLAGCSILGSTSSKKIVKLAKNILDNKSVYNKMAKSVNPYGGGDSSKKIVEILKKQL